MKKDWQELLRQANKELKKAGAKLIVTPDEQYFSLDVVLGNGKTKVNYAGGYREDELMDLITEAWASVKDGSVKDDPVLKERLIEAIQDISIQAWPVIYPVNSDSRSILSEFRRWGEEFEQWWNAQPAKWLEENDYIEEIEKFTDRKCEEYLKSIGYE